MGSEPPSPSPTASGRYRFATQLLVRLGGLLATLILLAYLLASTSQYAAALLVGAAALFQVRALVRHVDRTNQTLARILDSIRYQDLQQHAPITQLGPGFADLAVAFDGVSASLRATRAEKEAQARYLAALVEHVPVAMLTLHSDGRLELLNNAARRLLNAAQLPDIDALDAYGHLFRRDLTESRPGERKLSRIVLDGVERQLVLSTTQITLEGDVQRLISLQDIQSELDASELAAWQDMVRVISHEILNSITPISSLARTADGLVQELQKEPAGAGERSDELRAELTADIRDAISTLARRSEALMHFVSSYRRLTQMPPPRMKKVAVCELIARLERLLATDWAGKGTELEVAPVPAGLRLTADEELVEQALINLLSNAAHAARTSTPPRVWLQSRLNERGQIVIEVADNGPGVNPEHEEKIFLPFFTTRPDGSGVGLSLVRQVMLLHRGSISVHPREGGGALFRMTF